MAIVCSSQHIRTTLQDLRIVACDLWEAEDDARLAGLVKMADCLGRMKAAIRSMAEDIGETNAI
jgi:hypothetical protein